MPLHDMKLRLEPLDQAEFVHYASTGLTVTSHAQHIRVEHDGVTQTFALPVSTWERPILPFRLLRRASRLDKCNVLPIFENGKLTALVAVRQGRVYRIDYPSGTLVVTLRLERCRVVLHQSMCTTPAGHIYFGEYGANRNRKPVPVYRSLDAGRSWEKIYEFPAGSTKHVHGCFWDPHAKRVWVCTGDFANENILLSADEDFRSVEQYGDGSQTWRTCAPLFFPDSVVWPMDSQLETSYLCRFDRRTKTVEKLQAFPGPVWYLKQLTDGWYVLATANEQGVGVTDDHAHVLVSRDALHWEPLHKVRHDGLPKYWFKFGVIAFADGPQSSGEFYLFAEALTGMDGRAFRCALVPND
jgi:hypothetical protein